MDDWRRIAVVYIKKDPLCFRIIQQELFHNPCGSTSKRINRLVIVPHSEQVAISFCKQIHNGILNLADILKLIDQKKRKMILKGRKNIFPKRKQLQRLAEDVIKIQQLIGRKCCLICLKEQPKGFRRKDGRGGHGGKTAFDTADFMFQRFPKGVFLLINMQTDAFFLQEYSFFCGGKNLFLPIVFDGTKDRKEKTMKSPEYRAVLFFDTCNLQRKEALFHLPGSSF